MRLLCCVGLVLIAGSNVHGNVIGIAVGGVAGGGSGGGGGGGGVVGGGGGCHHGNGTNPMYWPCNVDDSENQGVCMGSGQCSGHYQRVVGNCGMYGSMGSHYDCCKTIIPCGGVVRNETMIAYYQNPSYPDTQNDPLSCNINVEVSENVCQLRLDLIDFELPVPDLKTGQCSNKNAMNFMADSMPLGVFGKGSSALCGLNSGQHFYVPVTSGSVFKVMTTLQGFGNPSSLSMQVTSYAYKWNIMITQIDCGLTNNPNKDKDVVIVPPNRMPVACEAEYYYNNIYRQFIGLRAPAGCLQYFTGKYDKLTSFNFDGYSIVPPNQDYTICIRPDIGMSSGLTLRAQTFKMPVTGICADGAKIVDEKLNVCCINTPNSGYLAYTGYQKFNKYEALRRYWCGQSLGPEMFMSGNEWNIRVVTESNYKCEFDAVGFSIEYKVDIGL